MKGFKEEVSRPDNWWTRFNNEFDDDDKLEALPEKYLAKYASYAQSA